MSKIMRHITLIVVSIFSLAVITINDESIREAYRTYRYFQDGYQIYNDYNLAIEKISQLSYESYDNSEFAPYVNSSDNLPCTTIAGHHYRLVEKKNPGKWDKYDNIPDWNFFINVYETNLPIESAESYFDGIVKGITATIGDDVTAQRGSYNGSYPTLLHPDIVENEPANTIVVFTDYLAYHITAIDSTESDELGLLLNHLSFNIPPEISVLPWKLTVIMILLEICLLIELLLCVRNHKSIGSDNKVARGFAIFTFVSICAYLIASIAHSAIATSVNKFCNSEYTACIWIYSGSVFFLSALFHKLSNDSHSQAGVGFILPPRWKARLQDNKMSRTIVILVCYPCLITLVVAGFLAIPFVLFVYLAFLLIYLISHAVKWIISGSIY